MIVEEKDEKEPLKILVHAPLGVGGVSGLMLNIQRNIDREKLNFDYLVFHDRVEPQEQAAFDLGSKKIVASADEIKIKWIRGIVRLFRIRKVCRQNRYKILHFNGGAPMGLLSMLAAKLGGVKHITFHSHNGGMSNEGFFAKPVSALCKPFMDFVVDDYWACSGLAAKFSFPGRVVKQKRFYFMPNAIDVEKYAYNEKVRKAVRHELGLEGKFVVGHAGRFNHQKNHEFLIEIFQAVHEKDSDAVLLLFGVGELLEHIKEKVHVSGLDDFVIFYGNSDEMEKMYQAMDVFLMPSKFEGLPVVGVEAQAAALPVVFSDVVTQEVQITDKVSYVPLNASLETWVSKILDYKGKPRIDQTARIKNAGFEQASMVEHFQAYYMEIGRKLRIV